jgi:Tol biopolymer transport system component
MPATISPAVRHTIKMCLEKDARKRVADIRDVRLALEGAFETGMPRGVQPAQTTGSHRVLPIAIAATLAAVASAAVFYVLQPPPPTGIVTRFSHAIPENVFLRNDVTSVLDIAPSGEFFVFNGTDGITMRLMGDVQSRVIPGTDGNVADVVVSPDSRDLVYFRAATGGVQLAKVAIGGGAPIVLAEPLGNPFGISWESDGTILFGQPDGIWRVSENGGTPVRIIAIEETEQAYGPQLLPGGDWVLFSLAPGLDATRWDQADIVVESLETGERRVLRSGGHDARYLPTGHLTYVFENVLFASAFDPASLELDDERVSLIQGVETASQPALIGGSGFYAVADNGTLVFIPGEAGQAAANPERGLAWVDRRGNSEPLPVPPDDYTRARISPDGTKVALVVGSTLPATDPPPDIYIFDLETENLRQLTFDPGPDSAPVWSRDSSRIFFQSTREDGVAAVYVIPADGGTADLLASSEQGKSPQPWSISADGETLLLIETPSVNPTEADIAALAINESDEVTAILEDGVFILEPSLSPNGEWLAYYSSQEAGGRPSIDIRPFPDVNQQRRPIGTGRNPVFSTDGSELFITDEGGISAIPVQYDPFRVGTPEQLFRGQYQYGGAPSGDLGRAWDVDPVNDRFLMVTLPGADVGGGQDQVQLQIDVILNWFEELKQRVPVD